MTGFQDIGDVATYAAFVLLPCVSGWFLARLARHIRQRPQKQGWLALVGVNFLVFLFLISVVMLALESYYRFWCDSTDSFALTRVSKRWRDRHCQINQAGFRDNVEVYPVRRDHRQHRISFVGDSFTAGQGIVDVEDRFANRIRRRESNWEIHVLASDGLDTGDELDLVQTLADEGYQWDQVVLVYCLNDIADIVPEWGPIRSRIIPAKLPSPLFFHSFLLNTYYYRLKGFFDPDVSDYYHFLHKVYDGAEWDVQKRRLRELKDLVGAHKGHLLVVTFPFLQNLGPHYEYGPVHDKLNAFWRDMGVPHLDLRGVFESHRGRSLVVNSHDAHPNVYAHALAADAIASFLENNIATNSQPPTSYSTTGPDD